MNDGIPFLPVPGNRSFGMPGNMEGKGREGLLVELFPSIFVWKASHRNTVWCCFTSAQKLEPEKVICAVFSSQEPRILKGENGCGHGSIFVSRLVTDGELFKWMHTPWPLVILVVRIEQRWFNAWTSCWDRSNGKALQQHMEIDECSLRIIKTSICRPRQAFWISTLNIKSGNDSLLFVRISQYRDPWCFYQSQSFPSIWRMAHSLSRRHPSLNNQTSQLFYTPRRMSWKKGLLGLLTITTNEPLLVVPISQGTLKADWRANAFTDNTEQVVCLAHPRVVEVG